MSEPPLLQRIFVSGERVEPGIYRDMETGSLVQVLQTDELPGGVRIVHYTRLFVREDEDVEETAADETVEVCCA